MPIGLNCTFKRAYWSWLSQKPSGPLELLWQKANQFKYTSDSSDHCLTRLVWGMHIYDQGTEHQPSSKLSTETLD